VFPFLRLPRRYPATRLDAGIFRRLIRNTCSEIAVTIAN
jgi:hypothetical protein